MVVKNLSLPIGINNMTSMGTYMNTVTGSWFWNLVLIAFYVTLFIILQRISTTAKSAATTGFVVVIIAIFMSILSWISLKALFIAIIAAIFGIVALYLESRTDY